MNTYNWYSTIIKPAWAPPSYLFGPVWTVLYIMIVFSFGKVITMYIFKTPSSAGTTIPFIVVLPFILNLIFNFAFTPLQFGLKNNLLAAIDIVLVLATLIWAMVAIYPHIKWVTYMQIPYLLWVTFATFLQITITYLNR